MLRYINDLAAAARGRGHGFRIQARRDILTELLQVQEQFGEPLISSEEVDLIHKIWAAELQQEELTVNG